MSLPRLLLVSGLLMVTATNLNSNGFKYYGIIGGELQIKAQIYMACMAINSANVNEASKLLACTVAVETNNGDAVDFSNAYGEGLTQFDRATFEDIKKHYSNPKFDYLYNKILTYLLTDIRYCNYEDLRARPMLSIVYARLLFYRVAEPIPLDTVGQFNYYKKYFNSFKGATTLSKYLEASKKAVFS